MSQSPHRFLLVSDASAFSRSSPSVTARSFRFCKPRKKSRSDCEANGDWMQTTEGFTSWNDNTLSSTLQHVTFCSHIHALQTSPGVFFFLFYPFLLFLVIPCHNSQLITVLLLPPFSFLMLFLSFSSPPSFNVEAMAMVTSPPSSAYILQLMNGKSHTNHALGHFASPECQCSLWPRVADLVQIRFAWQGWGFVQAKLWKKHTILAHLHLISVLAEALLWHVHNHNLKDPVIGTSNSLTLQSWTAARGLILLAPVSSRLMQLSWDLGLPNHQHSNPWQCSWVMKSNTDLYMAVVRVQLLFQANTAAVHNAPKSLPKRATYFLPLVEAKPSTFVMVSAWIPVTLPPKNQTMVVKVFPFHHKVSALAHTFRMNGFSWHGPWLSVATIQSACKTCAMSFVRRPCGARNHFGSEAFRKGRSMSSWAHKMRSKWRLHSCWFWRNPNLFVPNEDAVCQFPEVCKNYQ